MAKNGNSKTFITIASIVLGVIMAGGAIIASAVRVESKVDSHVIQADKDLKANEIVHIKLENSIKEIDGECEGLGKDMIEIKTEIKYIRKDMTEILTYIRGLPK